MSDFISNTIDLKNTTSIFPREILENIYVKHKELYYSNKYKKLLITLNDDISNTLNIKNILPHVDEILNDKYYISYLQNNDTIFRNIYQKHYIHNNKNFQLLDVKDSFALSWLMYLHH